MWQEWLQQKPRVANPCAEENWSSVPEQYKMLKCESCSSTDHNSGVGQRLLCVCCAAGFLQVFLTGTHSELKQQQCLKHLGWLFHKQLEIVVNRPFFFRVGSVETRLELQWNKSFLTRSFSCSAHHRNFLVSHLQSSISIHSLYGLLK